jgi:hypothetical protein
MSRGTIYGSDGEPIGEAVDITFGVDVAAIPRDRNVGPLQAESRSGSFTVRTSEIADAVRGWLADGWGIPVTWMDVYLEARIILPAQVRLATTDLKWSKRCELRASGVDCGPLVFGFSHEEMTQHPSRLMRDVRRWAGELGRVAGRSAGWDLSGFRLSRTSGGGWHSFHGGPAMPLTWNDHVAVRGDLDARIREHANAAMRGLDIEAPGWHWRFEVKTWEIGVHVREVVFVGRRAHETLQQAIYVSSMFSDREIAHAMRRAADELAGNTREF